MKETNKREKRKNKQQKFVILFKPEVISVYIVFRGFMCKFYKKILILKLT